MTMKRLLALVALGPLLIGAAGCSTNPATGESSFTAFMSPAAEKQVGAQEHPKLVQEMGGSYSDAGLAAYVDRVGQEVARHSEVQDLQYSFTVIDSDDINAFALPGGYVHVTRGLLALASNEAELAGVLGHEIGHVTARHAAQRYSTATAAGLGVGLLGILGAVAGLPPALGDVAGSGAAAYLQSYSRDQEMQADELGIRYMTQAGYDPDAMVTFFRKLDAFTRLQASEVGEPSSGERFNIMASHPRTTDRVQQATKLASAARAPGEEVDSKRYLAAIDGLVYGDSPAQGFRRGLEFIHTGLGIGFRVPEGFVLKNSPNQVVAAGPNGAVIVFDADDRAEVARRVPEMRAYLTQVWAQKVRLAGVERIDVNGMEAATGAARLQASKGVVDVRLVAIRGAGNRIWRFALVAPPQSSQRLDPEFRRTVMSFHNLTGAEAATKPWRIQVATVQPGDTPEKFAGRMAMDTYKLETFRVLNGLETGDRLTPGQGVKIVVE